MNEQIYNWLKSFPGLELLQWQQVDAVAEGCGLFFRGATVKDTRTNLLGQTQHQKTFHFRINRYGESAESALFFLMLGQWAQESTPRLGADQTATCKNARCVRDTGGLALWEADLEITYWEEL